MRASKFNKYIISKPSAHEMIAEPNTEIKALLIKLYGYEEIIKELGAEVIYTYKGISKITSKPLTYELLEFQLDPYVRMRVIVVEDHSSHKKVFLGVPIEKGTDTCIGAIAWTFNMTAKEYKPLFET